MKEVIYITDKKEPEEKPVEFTHSLSGGEGWVMCASKPEEYDKIYYLGKCTGDGDMFSATAAGYIFIFKGHLNSGKY